jgi:hypothetical protein
LIKPFFEKIIRPVRNFAYCAIEFADYITGQINAVINFVESIQTALPGFWGAKVRHVPGDQWDCGAAGPHDDTERHRSLGRRWIPRFLPEGASWSWLTSEVTSGGGWGTDMVASQCLTESVSWNFNPDLAHEVRSQSAANLVGVLSGSNSRKYTKWVEFPEPSAAELTHLTNVLDLIQDTGKQATLISAVTQKVVEATNATNVAAYVLGQSPIILYADNEFDFDSLGHTYYSYITVNISANTSRYLKPMDEVTLSSARFRELKPRQITRSAFIKVEGPMPDGKLKYYVPDHTFEDPSDVIDLYLSGDVPGAYLSREQLQDPTAHKPYETICTIRSVQDLAVDGSTGSAIRGVTNTEAHDAPWKENLRKEAKHHCLLGDLDIACGTYKPRALSLQVGGSRYTNATQLLGQGRARDVWRFPMFQLRFLQFWDATQRLWTRVEHRGV